MIPKKKIIITKEEISRIELTSEPVQEIVGATPPRILKAGSVSLLFFILSLFVISNFLKYPDLVQGTFSVVSSEPSMFIKSSKNGYIESIYNQYDTVFKGSNLFHFESANDNKDIILNSPIDGIIIYPVKSQKKQYVCEGQLLCIIAPFKRKSITGELRIPVKNSGKIKSGQQVNLKFDKYPGNEYGILTTRLSGLSPLIDSVLIGTVELSEKMETNFKIPIFLEHNLRGTFEIITESRTLFEKIARPETIIKKK